MFNFNHLGIEYKEPETQYPLKKKNTIVMIMRNINQSLGIRNEKRVVIKELHDHFLNNFQLLLKLFNENLRDVFNKIQQKFYQDRFYKLQRYDRFITLFNC